MAFNTEDRTIVTASSRSSLDFKGFGAVHVTNFGLWMGCLKGTSGGHLPGMPCNGRVWKSEMGDDLKRRLFLAAVESMLL